MARRSLSKGTSRRSRDEDEYDETPDESGALGKYDDDEEDERPRRSRGRSRRASDDDEDLDEAPRSRRSGRSRRRDDDDSEEDEAPRRSRGRRSSDDDEHLDEDRPKKRKASAGRGWGGYEKAKSLSSDFVDPWKLPERPTLIKFLEPEPFTNYAEHFINELPKGTKKSYTCLRTYGEDCPICDELGDNPNVYSGFNILDLSDPDNPTVAFLRASKSLTREIETYAKDKRTKPINRWDVYFTLHREDRKGARAQLVPVKARDVEDDWDMSPFEEDELAEYESDMYSEDQVVFASSRKQLKDVVAMVDEDWD